MERSTCTWIYESVACVIVDARYSKTICLCDLAFDEHGYDEKLPIWTPCLMVSSDGESIKVWCRANSWCLCAFAYSSNFYFKLVFSFLTSITLSGVSVAPVTVDAVGRLLGGSGHLPRLWLVKNGFYKSCNGWFTSAVQSSLWRRNRRGSFVAFGRIFHYNGNFSE